MAMPTAICLLITGLLLLVQGSSELSHPRTQLPVPGELAAYAFVGAAVTVLVTVALLSYTTIAGLQNRARQVDHSYLVQGTFDDALARYQSARGFWRRYLARGDETDFLSLVPEVSKAASRFDAVLELTQNEPAQHQMLLAMKETFLHDLNTMQQTAGRKHQGDFPEKEAGRAPSAQPSLQAEWINARSREFVDYEESILTALRQSSQRSNHTGLWVVMAGNAIGFTILGIALWSLVYSLQQRAQLENQLRATNETLETRIAERTSELSRANAQLALLNSTLEQRIRERTADLEDFSYTVSHDLRAPLRAIDGYSMMLQEDQAVRLDEEGRRMLGQIRHYGQRMGHLIDDLLRMSRLGRQSLKSTMLDMTQLAEEVRLECLADAVKTSQKVALVKVEGLDSVVADASLIRQVWINLVSNALKYSSQVAQPQVWITSLVAETEVIYSIRDNGAGFDMAHADKLFGVFQRLHRNEEFTGTGVGLAIVDRIVRRHGGRVWAEGRPGEGATFHFTLPLRGSSHE
jgi:signal transduction histidine kinase